MSSIDSRVVEMQFNNSQFESNVKNSLNSIDRLKESLNFDGVDKSFDNISEAAKNVNMSGLGSAVEEVHAKFSALEVVAVTALVKITNQAIEAGEQLVKSLTIDQISAGWEKFAENTKNIGTLVSQGFDLDEVEDQMERLLWYTDETSYNYTDMVSNISKFTASGQGLTESVTAMEGIANWAALSGQNAETASRAMYQLAQAMSAGVMKLQDWKSIQNANMDTAEFRQKCLDAGVACGTLTQNIDGTYESLINNQGAFDAATGFTDHLTQDAWLTSEVMMTVYEDYANAVDQIYDYAEENGLTASEAIEELGDEIDEFGLKAFKSAQEARSWSDVVDSIKDATSTSWMNIFTDIFGDYEEATKLWTDLSNTLYDVFVEPINTYEEVLSEAMGNSGWSDFLDQGITYSEAYIEEIKKVAEENGIAVDDIVDEYGTFENSLQSGWLTADILKESLFNLEDSMSDLSEEELELAGYTQEYIDAIVEMCDAVRDGELSIDDYADSITQLSGRQNLLDAFWTAWDNIGEIVGAVHDAFREVFPASTVDGIYSMTESLKSLAERLKMSDTALENLKNAFQGIFSVFDIVIQAVKAVASGFFSLVGALTPVAGGFLSVTGGIGSFVSSIDEAIKSSDIFNRIVETIVDALKTGLSFVIDLAGRAVSAVKEFFDFLKETFHIPGLEEIRQSLKEFVDLVKEKFVTPGFAIFQSLLDKLHDKLNDISESTSGLKESVINAFKSMGEFLASCKFIDILNSLWTGITKIVSSIGSVFGSMIQSLGQAFNNADFNKFFDIINGILGSGLIVSLTSFFKQGGDAFSGFGDILKSVTGILDEVKGCFKAWQTELQAKILLELAGAIAVLSVSLIALTGVDSEKLGASLYSITVLFTDLVAATTIFTKIAGSSTGVLKSAAVLVAMSASVSILAGAVKKLGNLGTGDLIEGTAGTAALTAILVEAFKVLGEGESHVIKGASALVVIGASVDILVLAVQSLSKIGTEDMISGIAGIASLAAILVATFEIFGNGNDHLVKGASGIAIFSAAIDILIPAVKSLSKLDTKSMIQGITGVASLATIAVAAFEILGNGSKSLVKGSHALVTFSAAIDILIPAVAVLSLLDVNSMIQGITGVASMATIMVAAFKILGDGSVSMLAGSAAILVAASAMLILTPAIAAIGSLSINTIVKGLISLAASFAVIGAAAVVLSPLTTTIVALSASFDLLSAGVLILGAGLVAIGAGLTNIAVGFTSLSTSCSVGVASIVTAFDVIIAGIISLIPNIVIAIGEAIISIVNVIADSATTIANAVAEVLVAVIDAIVEVAEPLAVGIVELIDVVMETLAEHAGPIVDSLCTFVIDIIESLADHMPEFIQAVMDLVMSLFSGIGEALLNLDTSSLMEGILGIGILSLIMKPLSAAGSMVPAAMASVAEIAALVAEIALLLAAIGTLEQIPGLDWLIGEGGKLLEGIGSAIGNFVGGIIGGIAAGITSQFPQIGQDLSDFMDNLGPFLDGASQIDESMMSGVKALAETVLILTEAKVLDGLTSWFTGGASFVEFGEELAEFGPSLAKYADSVKDIDGNVVEASANAALTLAEMADKLPESGGLAGKIFGESSLSEFADELVEFGPKLSEYAESVDGITPETVEASANAALVLAEMASELPNSGGLSEKIFGDNRLSDFGVELEEFAPHLKAYADSVIGVDPEAIEASASAATILAEMADTLPNSGGLSAKIFGDNTLSAFGEEIAAFGVFIAEYSSEVAGKVDPDVVSASASAALSLAELANNLPDSGGLKSLFSGDNSIDKFGSQLASFGKYFVDYYAQISGIDAGKLSTITGEFEDLVALTRDLGNVDMSALSGFAQGLTTLGNAGVDNFVSAFTGSSAEVQTAVISMLDYFASTIYSNEFTIDDALAHVLDQIIIQFGKWVDTFKEYGSMSMDSLVTGVTLKSISVTNSFVSNLSSAVSQIKANYANFKSAGSYLVDGFAAGISENTFKAEAKAKAMASAASKAAQKALDEHSPSKVGYEIGAYFGEGFVGGIDDYDEPASDAGESIADILVDSISSAVEMAEELLKSENDFQPTIKPVLDMSDIRDGADTINALFSRAQASSISFDMNQSAASRGRNEESYDGKTGNTYQFTQNNYSPKALSRIDIYRQTKNQFSAFERMGET